MFRTLVLASTILGLGACSRATVDMNPARDGLAFGQSDVQGRMSGQMPVKGEFSDDLSSGTIYRGPGYLEFDFHVLAEDGWVMLGGSFDPAIISEGETVVLDPDEHGIYGCSGPGEWEAEFDEGAEEVTVSKEVVEIDGIEMIEVTMVATFTGAGEVTAVVVRPTNENPED
ncbi:MAG: hypothetical protein R3F61_09090 [Myxococcota bacterium]